MKTTTHCNCFAKTFKAFLFTFLLSAGFFASAVNAQTLSTNQFGYIPGDTVTLTGNGFQPGESVTMQVVNADGSPNSNDAPWNITADANGDFLTTWIVPGDSSALGELLLATADGQASALHAEITFVDAGFATLDFQQASNQDHPSSPISWINGILNPNNSDYYEGHGIPQRVIFTGIQATPGDTHSLVFRHQALKGGVHAYDFLMGWDEAILTTGAIAQGPINELQNLMAQKCNTAISSSGLSACTTATNVLAIECPDNMGDPSGITCGFPPALSVDPVIVQFEAIFGNRFIHVYGNQPVTWGELLFTGYTGSGDAYATYKLRWKSSSDKVLIALAGRSSQSCTTSGCAGYGAGCGAGAVSGGPYHFKLDEFDGVTTGSQDNQLQATPAPASPVCDSVVIAGPDSVCPGSAGHIYTASYIGLCSNITHHWSITGAGVIVGSATGASISVLAGTFCGSQFSICDTMVCTQGQVVCCRIINIIDHVPPVITCPNPASSVECPAMPESNFGTATATDNCDTSVGITEDDVTTPGSCAAEYSVTRTWTASDNCNNTSSCSRTVSVTDNTPPVLTCPSVSNVECPNAPSFGSASATDACDTLVVPTFADVTTAGACAAAYSVTRIWTATDDCGNASTCSRTISVTDNTPPSITCPTVSNVECPASPSFGAATATDLCDNSVVPTFSTVTTPGNCPQAFSVTRTWTATDDCGNSSTCSRIISVTDNTPPSITCPNPAASVECPNTPNFGSATASDLCDNSVVPTFSNVTTPGNCPQAFSVTRTWTATDDCGNSSTCSRTISVTDNTPPSITCPNPAASVECPNTPNFGSATASDLCDNSVVPTFSTVTTPGNCPQAFSVTRTWTATDDCGNSSTCSRTISVTDNTPPTITCPTVANVECPNPIIFGSATASDLCDNSVIPTFADVTTSGNCPFTVTRTWTATDDCGNSSTCSRTISVTDNTPPSITCPTVSNVQCPASPSFGNATASDLCDVSVAITNTNVTTPGSCPQAFSVTRTWTATDDCGNTSTCSRTISVTDNTPPSITCPTVANVECPNTPNFGAATASDLCDNSVVPTFATITTPGSCPQAFSVTRTWTATDDCGNSSTCSRTISVTDNTPPSITCPTVSNVQCPASPSFGAATATDLCDNSVVPTFSNVTTPGSCPQAFSVTRTWTATDDCGNSSTCSRTISVTDNTPPVITCPNPAASVECPNTPNFGSATASDLCDNSVVPTFSTVTTPGNCPQAFSVTRTWTATDDCGNSSTCSRTISVTDNTPPSITCPNPAASVECPNTPNFGSASASDLCDNSVVPTFATVTTPGSCPQEFSVTRTWTATDDCGNSSTCSRTISVTDNTPPSITCPNPAASVECPNTPNFGSATASDACDNSVIPTSSDVTTPGACPQEYTLTRTWTATDDCGNASTCSRTINVEDNTPPAITCPNPAASVECPGAPNFGSATASDLCDNSVIPTSSDVTTPGACPQEYSVTRTWTASDDCANISTCSRTISVTDNTPPSITCPSVTSPVECPATPSFGSASASDACDQSVIPTSSDVTTPGSCANEYSVTRTWTAADDCGNSSTCSRTISVEDNTPPSLVCPPDETVPGAPASDSNGPCIDLGGGGVATVTNPNPNGPHSHVGIDFRQPRNENHPATPLYWTNGINNHTQAEYFEGMGVPQRIIFTGLTGGPTHTLRFRHEAVKQQSDSRHAYDFLMSWNQAVATAANIGNNSVNELQNLLAQTCGTGISAPAAAACSNLTSFFPPDNRIAFANVPDNMGNPPNHHGIENVNDAIACFEAEYGDRNIEMRGNAPITSFSITFDGYSGGTNQFNYAWYTITWTSTSSDVMIKLAGRAAPGNDTCGYGSCFGAGSINGGPYHFKLELLDGYSVGNRDNQLMVDVDGCDPNIPVTFGTPNVSDNCDPNPGVTVTNSDNVTTNSDGSITHCRTWEATDACGNSSDCSQCITVSCDSAFINGPPQIVENPYEMHCTQTQNFWGSSNNGHLICSGDNSDDAKLWLLTSFGNINIGCPGNSLTLTPADVACINNRLPASGSDARIYGNNTCNSVVGIQLLGNGRFRNKLLGQTLALIINTRLDVTLGDVHLDGQYMSVENATGCDVDAVPNGNIHVYTIPASVITYLGANNSINDLIALANAALCGSYIQSVGTPTLKEISKAVESINTGFDGCNFLLGFSNTLRDGENVHAALNLDNPINAVAFPNPFNSNTTIRFALDNAYENVKLEIFNAIGEVVAVPFNGAADEGVTYTVEFDGNNQPGGIYFYRISAGTESLLDKLMLIK
jgi:hypothetical protein